uniref:Mitochondrial import inner membrane translocase subunit TIM22-3 n=1 Tax=Zea mays TaxID=4577 RepID=A0A804LQ18_MAIZE
MAARRGREWDGDEQGAALPTPAPLGAPVVCLLSSLVGYGKGLITNQGTKACLSIAGSSAKTFAALAGVQSFIMCLLRRLRGKDDMINAGMAGCCTGIALSFPGAPQAMFHSCVTFAAFSCIMDGLSKQQAAMALTLDVKSPTVKYEEGRVIPPFTLPPLLDALDPLGSFCQTLIKPKH